MVIARAQTDKYEVKIFIIALMNLIALQYLRFPSSSKYALSMSDAEIVYYIDFEKLPERIVKSISRSY